MIYDLSQSNMTFQELWELKSRILARKDELIFKRNKSKHRI